MRVNRALAVAGGGLFLLLTAYLLKQRAALGIAWLPACQFHRITGLDCPGCGMTRAVEATLHGQLGEAFRMNPLGMVFLLLGAFGIAIEIAGWVRGKPLPFRLKVGRRGGWAIVCIIGAFWVLRNIPRWPFTLLGPP